MVTIERETYYTLDEINSLISNGQVAAANQWEVYELSYNSGFSVGWNMCRMFVNKHTGAVTGILGMEGMSGSSNNTILTNSNLGIHADMRIKWPGLQVYTTTTSAASADTKKSAHLYNIRVGTDGTFTGQGYGFVRSQLETHIENFFYIGSKYGKITTEDAKPIYLPEGTFYNQNAVDLLTGKAWFEYRVPLDSEAYTSDSSLTFYKNLWSAECIVQYNLYPVTANTYPSISVPSRFMPYLNLTLYPKIRYLSPAPSNTQAKERCYIRLGGNEFYLGGVPSGTTRITGSNFYIGVEEKAAGLDTETGKGLWNRDASVQVPSAENTVFGNLRNNNISRVDITGMIVSGYIKRDGYQCHVIRSRTGMVNFAAAMKVNSTTLADPLFNDFSAAWRPSYKYRRSTITASGVQTIYFASPSFMSLVADTTPSHRSYTANICLRTNQTSGGNDAKIKAPSYGTTGNISPSVGNNLIWQGWYLADNT